jgi:hypothetical protein
MSAENVEIIRRGYEEFIATGEPSGERMDPEFVWDMSTFGARPERQAYEGIEGTREFMSMWVGAWEDWRLEVEELRDVGEKVVAIVRQRGRARTGGLRSTCASARSGRCATGSRFEWRCTRRRRTPSALPASPRATSRPD